MKLKKSGKNTLKAEIQNISKFGLWILIENKEYFLSFTSFPWFKNAKILDIYNLKLINGYHLYWPSLDIDLDLDSIKNTEKYPLIYSKANVSKIKKSA